MRDEPYQSGLCHCTTCRKLTGSSFSATANWRDDRVTMSGALQTYVRRSFCPRMRLRIFFLFDGIVEILLGSLDLAPNEISPMAEV